MNKARIKSLNTSELKIYTKLKKIFLSMKTKPVKKINLCKSMVQNIYNTVNPYGGSIWVKSTEGEGPEMIFFLPIED